MFFSNKALPLLSLVQFAATSQPAEEMFPNSPGCRQDRCVSIELKNLDDLNLFPETSKAQTYVETSVLGKDEKSFDYNLFDYTMSREVLCSTCLSPPQSTITADDQPIKYVRDNQNCQAIPQIGNAMTIKNKKPKEVTNVPNFRIISKDFWNDSGNKPNVIGGSDENFCSSNFDNFVDPCCLESDKPTPPPTVVITTLPPTDMTTTLPPTGMTPSPTMKSTTAPASKSCFSSVASVEVQGKGQISMKALQIGEMVLTPNGYEKVYTIDHRNENKETDFVRIYTELEKVLELTSEHLIYLHGKHDPVEAGSVKVGDKLQSFIGSNSDAVVVTQVGTVSRKGLYNPITSSGTIVVDGLATSTYTAVGVTGGSNYLAIGGYKLFSMHDFMHLAIGPFKAFCMNVPHVISSKFCLIDQGEEHNSYNKIGLQLLAFGKNQNEYVQMAIVISLVTLFVAVNEICNPVVIMILLIFTFKKLHKAEKTLH